MRTKGNPFINKIISGRLLLFSIYVHWFAIMKELFRALLYSSCDNLVKGAIIKVDGKIERRNDYQMIVFKLNGDNEISVRTDDTLDGEQVKKVNNYFVDNP